MEYFSEVLGTGGEYRKAGTGATAPVTTSLLLLKRASAFRAASLLSFVDTRLTELKRK